MTSSCLYCNGNAIVANGVQCMKCNGLYHKRCAQRCLTDVKGIYSKCCGDDNSQFSSCESLSSVSPNKNKTIDDSQVNEISEAEEIELAQAEAGLDDTLKPLWKLMQSRFLKIDGGLGNVSSTLNTTVKRVDRIDKRVKALEDSVLQAPEDVYREVKERMMREKNFIIFNADDGKDAATNDLPSLMKILIDSGLKIPFAMDDVKVKRLGKEFVEGKQRPLKVMLRSADHVQWVFANKKKIHGGKLILAADQTKAQQDLYNKVKKELIERTNKGEANLVIKYSNGVPSIVVKSQK